MAKKYSIYAAPVMDMALSSNGGQSNRSKRLAQICDRYLEILRHAKLPEFSESEWNLIYDALNGTWHEPAAMIRHVALGIEDAISLDGLASKWSVDGPSLITRLGQLSFAQEVALVEQVELYWSSKADTGRS